MRMNVSFESPNIKIQTLISLPVAVARSTKTKNDELLFSDMYLFRMH